MYIRMTQTDISNRLLYTTENGYTAEQCDTIAEWLLDLEESHGEETAYDAAEIRSHFTAYESIYELSECIHCAVYPKEAVDAWWKDWSEANDGAWRFCSPSSQSAIVVLDIDDCNNDI